MTSPSREERVAHLIECQRVAKTYGQEGDSPVPISLILRLSSSRLIQSILIVALTLQHLLLLLLPVG